MKRKEDIIGWSKIRDSSCRLIYGDARPPQLQCTSQGERETRGGEGRTYCLSWGQGSFRNGRNDRGLYLWNGETTTASPLELGNHRLCLLNLRSPRDKYTPPIRLGFPGGGLPILR